jgi:hypothetical protein
MSGRAPWSSSDNPAVGITYLGDRSLIERAILAGLSNKGKSGQESGAGPTWSVLPARGCRCGTAPFSSTIFRFTEKQRLKSQFVATMPFIVPVDSKQRAMPSQGDPAAAPCVGWTDPRPAPWRRRPTREFVARRPMARPRERASQMSGTDTDPSKNGNRILNDRCPFPL